MNSPLSIQNMKLENIRTLDCLEECEKGGNDLVSVVKQQKNSIFLLKLQRWLYDVEFKIQTLYCVAPFLRKSHLYQNQMPTVNVLCTHFVPQNMTEVQIYFVLYKV